MERGWPDQSSLAYLESLVSVGLRNGAVDGGEVVERLDAGGPEVRTHLSDHSLEAGLVEKLLEPLC